MNEKYKVPMAVFNKMSKAQQIATLCNYHECSEKKKAVHLDQYVNRQWNPHPPERFVEWWYTIGRQDSENETGRAWLGIDAVRAFNCQAVRDVYTKAKEFGVV